MSTAPSIEALATLSPAELRTRLPELFAAIDAADDASAPLVASLAGRAFDGNEGLDVLRDPLSVPFALRGLGHTDSQVRSLTAQQMTRLASTAADVNLLKERGLLSTLASLIDDEVLSVSQRAAEVFTACAAAGADPLRIVLTDEPTMQKLRQLGKYNSKADSVLVLRTFSVFASLAATGDAQFDLIEGSGLLEPVLSLWRAGDALVQLNIIELFNTLVTPHCTRGVFWLHTNGVLDELINVLHPDAAEEDPLVDLLRPAALSSLATFVETGGDEALTQLLGPERQLIAKLWTLLLARRKTPPEQLIACLTFMRAAAGHSVGTRAILTLHSNTGEADGLGKLLRAHEERTRIGAMAVAAQLLESYALEMHSTVPTPQVKSMRIDDNKDTSSSMEVDNGSPSGAAEAAPTAETAGGLEGPMRSLIASCTPSDSTMSPADARIRK